MSADTQTRQRHTKKASPQQGGGGEGMTDKAESLANSLKSNPTLVQGKEQLLSAYSKACDTCGSLQREYPSLSIGLVILTAFCIGLALPLAFNHFSPAAKFTREHSEAHAALDQVLSKYYDVKSTANSYTDGAKGKVAGAIKDVGLDALKVQAAKKMGETILSAKAGRDAASESASNLGSRMSDYATAALDSVMGAKDSLAQSAQDLTDKVLHRQPKETGIKGKIHEAKDALGNLLHKAGEAVHH